MNETITKYVTAALLVVVGLVFTALHVFFNVLPFSYLWYPLIGFFVALSLAIAENQKGRLAKETLFSKTLLDTYMFIVGYVLLSIGTVQLGVSSSLGLVFTLLGFIGMALVMAFQQGVVGLTNSEQTILSFASMVLLVIGNVTLPTGALPWQASVVLAVLGAIGIGLKEALGSLPPPTTQK